MTSDRADRGRPPKAAAEHGDGPSRIRLLAPEVYERVAAGEVIDGPAAVVKELVENRLDAGATQVRVEVQDGGLRLIRVADDGEGIAPNDVELAFQRHATSKIQTVDDLAAVRTLGFRGEALPSIAAVAEVTLATATSDGLATRVAFVNGRLDRREQDVRTRGTTVAVRHLFERLPGRLKFLQSRRIERQRITTVVRRLALSRPDVRFSLHSEGRLVLETHGGGPREAFADVFGAAVGDAAVLLGPRQDGEAHVYGFITGRGLTRPSRADLCLFVNGRWVESADLIAAIEAGYQTALPRGRHPILVLFVDLPPRDLEVNVHPAKREVRLAKPAPVLTALSELIRSALGSLPTQPTHDLEVGWPRLLPSMSTSSRRTSATEQGSGRRIAERGWPSERYTPPNELLAGLRPVAQLRDALIVCEGANGLYLVDQHRAHERIIYERLRRRYADGSSERAEVLTQGLVEPLVLELKPREAARLAGRLGELAALGLRCEWYGGRSFLVRAVPASGDPAMITSGLADVLAAAASEGDWHDSLLVALACRSALRKGRVLSMTEASILLDELAQTESPAVCPHGAPIVVYVSDRFLAQQFSWK